LSTSKLERLDKQVIYSFSINRFKNLNCSKGSENLPAFVRALKTAPKFMVSILNCLCSQEISNFDGGKRELRDKEVLKSLPSILRPTPFNSHGVFIAVMDAFIDNQFQNVKNVSKFP
jgi:hypothetical protein